MAELTELSEIYSLGLEVFGDSDKFKLWLETTNFALGNLKPVDLLRDSQGQEMVAATLIRIEHGIFI